MIKDIAYRFDGLNGVEGQGDWALHGHTIISASSIEKSIGPGVYFGNGIPRRYRLLAFGLLWKGRIFNTKKRNNNKTKTYYSTQIFASKKESASSYELLVIAKLQISLHNLSRDACGGTFALPVTPRYALK